MDRTFIIGHRGDFTSHIENSEGAIATAFKQGFSVETDIRPSADGRLVISHDATLERLFDDTRRLDEVGIKDLETLRTSKHEIITFQECLELLPQNSAERDNPVLFVHIKDLRSEMVQMIASELDEGCERTGLPLHKILLFFDPTFAFNEQLKNANPHIRTAYSLGEDGRFPDERYPTVYTKTQIDSRSDFDAIWGDEWHSDHYTEELIQEYANHSLPFYVISPELHTFTDPKHEYADDFEMITQVWQDVTEWGCSGICTDHPLSLEQTQLYK